jgi:cobalamin biosynthesis protein CobT
MLGPKASQLTKLFVQQTKPRTLHNRTNGSLDVIALANDIHDTRDDIYSNNQGAKLDKAAVTFLVDNSGSMSKQIGDMYAILSGILMHLSRACIPTEAIGYTVAGGCRSEKWRDVPAYISIIKEFKEPYGGKVMRRCTQPYLMDETNDLDGMRFAVPRLWARPEKKKIIMVLCDGKPSMGNLTSVLSKAYKEYIEICRKAGIIVFGIGIGADLKEFFGDDFVSVDTYDVGDVLLTKLTQILNRKQA